MAIIQVTLNNRLSDGLPDFLMKVSDGSPHLKAGTVAGSPRDVASLTAITPFNAGIYQSSASNPAVEGVVAYTLPGISKSMLVIYFSHSKCRLLLLPDNTSVTADIIDQAEEEDRETAEGSFVSQGMTINWTAEEDRSVIGIATQYTLWELKALHMSTKKHSHCQFVKNHLIWSALRTTTECIRALLASAYEYSGKVPEHYMAVLFFVVQQLENGLRCKGRRFTWVRLGH
ncbi:hypothetical protein B0H17DRAFT_1143961 [Mycena rosella]|uniref:Uncharacterized protein n=1 Tax=Mycena rosella TaxID=1033263 RepID=A0AAD7CU82_MYCRO|nr:hypothetical protein B0H17DRAFT_1143961 [Mycena rosella]